MKQPQDRLPKKPTKAQLEALAVEQQRQQEFVDRYNALCDEYGYTIVPQVTVQLAKR